MKTLPAMLAERAEAAPEEPWLFYRRGWDWLWLSWSQVACQVARGAEALRRSGVFEEPRPRIAFTERFDPDSIAAALAIQAAGGVAVAATHSPDFVLPRAPSRLERWTADLSALGRECPDDGLVFGSRTLGDLWGTVDRWQSFLPALGVKRGGRPIALASAAVGRSVWEVLTAWTLLAEAAWVLEDDPDAFVSATLRNRPTLIVAPGDEAGLVALAMKEKAHRRSHRVRAVVLTDDAPEEVVRREEWDALGVRVVRLGQAGTPTGQLTPVPPRPQ